MEPTTREHVFARIRETLANEFELDEAKLVESARFFEDLDLDSIDAVDLIVRLKNETGLVVSADDFKSIRTLGDLADVLTRLTETQAK